MNTNKYLVILIALICISPAKNLCYGQNQHLTVNKTYSPPWLQTLICAPDDPVKTLVGKEGQIFGDFNYKGPRNYSFSIQFDGNEPLNWESQNLTSARIPVLHTVKTTANIEVTEQTFLHVPPELEPKTIVRYDGRKVLTAFSRPVIQCDPLFSDAALGKSIGSGEGSIDIHLKVSPASSQYIVLGFCEGKWKETGKRIMRVEIEGVEDKVIDPVKDFGWEVPGTFDAAIRDRGISLKSIQISQ